MLLTKPPGFQLNSTVRAAQLANFEPDPSLGDNWIDNFGATLPSHLACYTAAHLNGQHQRSR